MHIKLLRSRKGLAPIVAVAIVLAIGVGAALGAYLSYHEARLNIVYTVRFKVSRNMARYALSSLLTLKHNDKSIAEWFSHEKFPKELVKGYLDSMGLECYRLYVLEKNETIVEKPCSGATSTWWVRVPRPKFKYYTLVLEVSA